LAADILGVVKAGEVKSGKLLTGSLADQWMEWDTGGYSKYSVDASGQIMFRLV
jgi:hypothetical protein